MIAVLFVLFVVLVVAAVAMYIHHVRTANPSSDNDQLSAPEESWCEVNQPGTSLRGMQKKLAELRSARDKE